MNFESPWTVYRTRFLVHARQLTEPFFFTDALGREHSGQPGDYLVEFREGVRRITPREAFEDIYVPMESPHGFPGRSVPQSKQPMRVAQPLADGASNQMRAIAG